MALNVGSYGLLAAARNSMNPKQTLQSALAEELPLQIAGAVNANHALLARSAGFKAIYLSGAGVAAGSLGLPDIGLSGLDDVLTDVRRITAVCDLPLLVDAGVGFGLSAFNLARTSKSLIDAGAAAMHISDQDGAVSGTHQRHRKVISPLEMMDRIKAAVDARTDDDFAIMARIDSLAVEGLQSAIDRACAYVEAGADMIFPEAVTDLTMYQEFVADVAVPVLANLAEFGTTPLYTVDELAGAGVSLALYPHSAFKAMNKAAYNVYNGIRQAGTQQHVLNTMQTPLDLHDLLGHKEFERTLDSLFTEEQFLNSIS